MPAPKMMFASGSAAAVISCAASLISTIEVSGPPVMLISTARAPSIEVSSIGLEIACFAASTMRFSPLPMPMPICARPRLCITVRTSAKSRLIMDGTAIRSEMP